MVIVTFGWRASPNGSIAGTGSRNDKQTPPRVVVANVIPRSDHDIRAGPATFHIRNGPVTSTATMLNHGVTSRHQPKRTSRPKSDRVTALFVGVTRNNRDHGFIRSSKLNAKLVASGVTSRSSLGASSVRVTRPQYPEPIPGNPGGFGVPPTGYRRNVSTFERRTLLPVDEETAFDLSLSIDAHLGSFHHTGESAVAGVTQGIIGLGEFVTWRARHLGITWTMTSTITAWEPPTYFVDEQSQGPFKSFRHEHRFAPIEGGTELHDFVRFEAPLGILGAAVDRMVLSRYLPHLIDVRNQFLVTEATRLAEADHDERGHRPAQP